MHAHSSAVSPVSPLTEAGAGAPATVPWRDRWARGLRTAGFVAMLVGVLDPLEGSILILAGSSLVALGTWLGPHERGGLVYRSVVFALIAIGVTSLFALSTVGLGPGGLSLWWGLLALPYLAGWTMGLWGPDSPRWVLLVGLAAGTVCLSLAVVAYSVAIGNHQPAWATFVLLPLGVVTLAGCAYRLYRWARPR